MARAQTVTGSQHLLRINGYSLLLSAGFTRTADESFRRKPGSCRLTPADGCASILSARPHLITAAT